MNDYKLRKIHQNTRVKMYLRWLFSPSLTNPSPCPPTAPPSLASSGLVSDADYPMSSHRSSGASSPPLPPPPPHEGDAVSLIPPVYVEKGDYVAVHAVLNWSHGWRVIAVIVYFTVYLKYKVYIIRYSKYSCELNVLLMTCHVPASYMYCLCLLCSCELNVLLMTCHIPAS